MPSLDKLNEVNTQWGDRVRTPLRPHVMSPKLSGAIYARVYPNVSGLSR